MQRRTWGFIFSLCAGVIVLFISILFSQFLLFIFGILMVDIFYNLIYKGKRTKLAGTLMIVFSLILSLLIIVIAQLATHFGPSTFNSAFIHLFVMLILVLGCGGGLLLLIEKIPAKSYSIFLVLLVIVILVAFFVRLGEQERAYLEGKKDFCTDIAKEYCTSRGELPSFWFFGDIYLPCCAEITNKYSCNDFGFETTTE